MHKARVTSAEKVRHQARNTEFLEVRFHILDMSADTFEVLEGLEFPKGTVYKAGAFIALKPEEAEKFAEGLLGEKTEGMTVSVKSIGMAVASTKEDVMEMVNKHVLEHGRELENAVLDAEKQKANANVKDIQENLVGETFSKAETKTIKKEEAGNGDN